MQPIPGYDYMLSQDPPEVDESQLNILVALIYMATMLFVFQLVVITHNILAFLIRQRKYKTWPLLLFYTLAIILSLMRAWYIFFIFEMRKNSNLYGFAYKSFVKIDLGLT